MSRYKIDPFLYTQEEKEVLKALITQHTPLEISRFINIPRSTAYFVLEKLKTRGLVKKERVGKKYLWYLKKNDTTDFKHEQHNQSIKIYDTKELVDDFLSEIVRNDGERFKCFNGDNIVAGWKENVGVNKMIEFNGYLKNNGLISDLIHSKKFLIKNTEGWGNDWATSFKQKPTEYHVLQKEYADHGGQIFLKNNKVYIININKPLIIEIIDPEISKMFLLMFEFIKDHSQKVNIGEFLNMLKQ